MWTFDTGYHSWISPINSVPAESSATSYIHSVSTSLFIQFAEWSCLRALVDLLKAVAQSVVS